MGNISFLRYGMYALFGLFIYGCIFISVSTNFLSNINNIASKNKAKFDNATADTFNNVTADTFDNVTHEDTCIHKICGRCIPLNRTPVMIQGINDKNLQEKIIIIGTAAFGQTNNQINSVLNALLVARVTKSSLFITAGSWAHGLLKLFLDEAGIQSFEQTFGARILHNPVNDKVNNYYKNNAQVSHMTGEDLFYYRRFHPNITSDQVRSIDRAFFEFFWLNAKSESCSSVNYFGLNQNEEPYTVIHSRRMNKQEGNCPTRILPLADRFWKSQKVHLDQVTPCELPPLYVHSILIQNNLMYTTRNTTTSIDEATGQHLSSSPIYIITDGFNPYIIQNLKEDPLIGHRIYEVPDNKTIRWVVEHCQVYSLVHLPVQCQAI